MSTDFLWKRFDLCASVNHEVNAAHAGAEPAAVAAAKASALEAAGVPAGEVSVCDISTDDGKSYAIVTLVEDRIARWVLRHGSDGIDHVERKSAIIRPRESGVG